MATTKRRAAVKRVGAPEKVPGGLGQVLYVRATQEMLDALDARAIALREETGLSVSRADVARKLLGEALGRAK